MSETKIDQNFENKTSSEEMMDKDTNPNHTDLNTETTQIQSEISLDIQKPLNEDENNNDEEKFSSPQNSKLDDNRSNIKDSFAEKIYLIKSMKENIDIKYGLLIGLIKVNQIEVKEIVDAVLYLLVNGPFDMEQNFMIYSSQCVIHMLDVIQVVDSPLKAELLSVFIGLIRKSKCNLMMTMETNFIEKTLEMLKTADKMAADLLIEMLGIVASFSVSVKELKSIFQILKGSNHCWPVHSVELLNVLQQMPIRSGPDEFFNFPGSIGSAIAIPPISKWPYQNGWTFNCWIHLDPASAVNIDRDKPYLYCFRTNKGLGYSGHFVGSNLVITTMKMKDKGLQHCVKYNLQPRRWYMVSVVYVYNRWTKSEIRCYIDGELISQVEMPWQINTNEGFDRCFIGASPEQKTEALLTGQISCIYGFAESLNPHQIAAIYSLGPSYKGNFKFEAECPQNLSDSQRKSAFEGRLCHSLMFAYNPVACDRQLCLNQAPKINNPVFAHSSHALMTGNVRPVLTQSIYSTLHSLGGVRILFPLFSQLDFSYRLPNDGQAISNDVVPNIGARLINLLFELLYGSPAIRHQLVQSKGILLISYFISRSNLYLQLNSELLDSIIKLCLSLSQLHIEHLSKRQNPPAFADQLISLTTGPKFQYATVGSSNIRNVTNGSNNAITDYKVAVPPGSSHALELVKHVYDYLLSNTAMWIHASPEVQLKLHEFLANDFLSEGVVFNKTRCINAVLQCLNSIKYYYWLVNPRDRSGILSKIPESAPALNTEQITNIRSSIFQFIKKLMLKCHNGVLDEEMQGFLNYLTVVNEDDNIRHVLFFCVTLMSEQPSTMVPAFDHKHGIKVIFKLLASLDETVRIMALKLLGFYLQRSTYKRKQDSMVPHNLFTLIGERLLLYSPYLTMAMYNTLYEIMTEKMTLKISVTTHSIPDKTHHLENPALLKVIAHLIRQSKNTKELLQVRKMFLTDLNHLCSNSKENRRTVLQMSVWQDWLFILTPLSPQTPDQEQMLDAVLNLVRLLLHHAMKVEYGGWRVWIDTLAILHSKVAYHEFRRDMRKVYEQYEQDHSDHPSYSNIKHQHGINTASRASSSSGYRMSMEYGDENVKEERPSQSVDLAESVAKMIIDDIVVTACDLVTESAVAQSNTENQIFSPGPRSVPFRIPAFTWSQLHQRLLHDLLCSIESDLQIWKRSNNRNILEFVNATENQVYVINLVHLVTMLSDSLITCCGGLLPLLAAATSPSGDVDMLENGNGMAMSHAVCFLLRVMNIADIVVFASSLNFVELEQEKTMSNGGILRQCLRLVCTCAVRNCLENRFRDLHYQLFNESNLYEAHSSNEDSKFDDNLPPDPMQELMRGLRPRSDDVQVNELLLQNYPISDPEVLLQEMDINRLRAVVYRDVEEAKQAQFLALSIVYFLSVLMVSRYRDLLEPSPTYDSYSLESSVNRETNDQDRDKFEKLNHEKADVCATVEEEDEEIHYSQTENKTDTLRVEEEIEENVSEEIRNNQEDEEEDECDDDIYAREISFESDGRKSRISGNVSNEDSEESDSKNTSAAILDENENENEKTPPISSIQIDNHADNSSGRFQQFTSTLPQFPEQRVTDNRKHEIIDRDDEDYPKSNFPSSTSLTKRLEQALGGTAPLIREIFFDFSSYLSRTLIGSHGQELVSSGLVTLRQSTSVVEMVMLLCSQEWQNSLQKHAGLAFIELVNEGRLLAHASLDHTVRVANEAHFILSRMRAEDVQKHSEFTRLCAIMHQERQAEERLSEHLIASARTRDDELANKLKSRVESLVFSSHGVWASDQNEYNEFYRLDYWEDDSRRRRRFVSNPYGSTHPEAILPTASLSGDSPPIIHNKSKTEIFKNTLKELNLKSNVVAGVSINDNTMTSESGYGVTDEELFDAEKSEPRSNEDNQLEADLDSEQDLSESSYKIPDNKDSNQNKISDDTKSAQGIKKVSESETVTNNSLAKPINMDITGPVFLSTPAILLAPGVSVHGSVSITKSELYFEMDANNKNNIGLDQKVLCYMHHLHGKWHFSEIRAIFSRKFLHKNIALEIFVANRMAVMFAFPDQETVRKVIYVLPRVGIGIKYCVSQHRKSSLASPRQIFKLSNMTQRWQQREISNFDYLMYLNTIAGRTYNDLNQYPIFPWVLANYESETIDLSSPSNYRDLSSPIGALNPSRKKFFDNRFKNWDDDSQSAFHYGTHYSTAAFVLNYLVRVEPFTTLFLNLQSGKFDHADRTFHSVAQTWKNCQRDTSDVKELIPEFFYLPEMFTNSNDYRFGKSEDGNIVDDVILPKWAKTPEDFVRINRQALESELVSCQLHHWIDLIFGYKQRGPEAIRSTNVFCYLTYEGSVNWDEIKDPMIRQALEDQIRSFGQTPSQLVTEPHPPRNSALHVSPLMFTPVHTDLLMMLKFVSNSPIVWMTANVHPQSPLSAVLTVSANYVYGVNKWNHVAADLSRRPVAAQTSMPTSLAGALSLATSPTIQNSQSGNMQSSLNSYRMSSVDSPHPDKLHNYVSSNVQLPLSMDPLLSQTTLINKRSLGEGFDLCMRPHNMQFACTPDNRVIFAGGFWDKSFRIFSVETGRLLQVVYGHFGVVVCIARSECGFNQDCYIVTGSTDCTIMLWLWGNRQHALLGDFNCRESAQPRMTITGHQAEIVCVQISGELGIIVSASKDSRCLIHTIQGELLRSLLLSDSFVDPYRLVISREGYILLAAKPCTVLLYTINGKSIGHLLNSDENMPLRPNMELDSSKMKNYQHSSISAMALTKDGDYVALSSNDGFVRVRRCHNLELVHSYPRCDAAITSLAITTDQRFILVGLCNGTIVIFNVDFNKWHHEYRDRYPAL